MKSLKIDSCPLCQSSHEPLIWTNNIFRVVLIKNINYRGYCRVDLIEHKKEMAELDAEIKEKFMLIIFKIERFILEYLNPDKINLASLGNICPHLHWHIIPRFKNDNHFPNSIWGAQKRININEFSRTEEIKFISALQTVLSQ